MPGRNEGDDTKLFFRFCGRLLGTALLERVPLQLNLSTALLKRLLGREPDLEDMKGFDEQLYRTYRLVATLPNVSGDPSHGPTIAVCCCVCPELIRLLSVPALNEG